MNKSNNPFKMAGSWLGLFFMGLLYTLFKYDEITKNYIGLCCFDSPISIEITRYPILFLIFGFLLGWGIHSLWGWIRK